MRARLRVDGHLREISPPDPSLSEATISRIKILAKLDIAERRLPQDGRTRITIQGREIDLRIATSPTLHGEGAVLRLLDKSAANAVARQSRPVAGHGGKAAPLDPHARMA